jgi:ribosomal protein L15
MVLIMKIPKIKFAYGEEKEKEHEGVFQSVELEEMFKKDESVVNSVEEEYKPKIEKKSEKFIKWLKETNPKDQQIILDKADEYGLKATVSKNCITGFTGNGKIIGFCALRVFVENSELKSALENLIEKKVIGYIVWNNQKSSHYGIPRGYIKIWSSSNPSPEEVKSSKINFVKDEKGIPIKDSNGEPILDSSKFEALYKKYPDALREFRKDEIKV